MKKAFLFMLAALCVSAAQAVTVNWSGTGDTSAKTYQFSEVVSFTSADRFYVSILFDGELTSMWNAATAGNARPDMITLKNSNGDTVIDLNFRKSGGWYVQLNGSDLRLDNNLKNITLTFEATQTDGAWSAINYTVSGTHPTTADVRTHTGTLSNTLISDIASVEVGGAIGGVTLGNIKVDVTNVPEPTALALLALGVAGLALKRKVA